MSKKIIIPTTLILFLIIGGGLFLFLKKDKKTEPEPEKKQVVVERFNELGLKKRPFISLQPSLSGGEFYLSVDNSQDQLLEYEVEYQALNEEGGTLIQGGMGRIDLSTEDMPTKPKEFCFCSESKGKKKYDIGVNGGTLILRFSGGEYGDYALKGDFTVANFLDKEGVFNSRDAKFIFDLSASQQEDDLVLIVSDTYGLPGPTDYEILSGPYGVFPADNTEVDSTKAMVAFQSNQALADAKILLWDNKADDWVELDNQTVEDNKISAPAPYTGVYILVN